MLLAGTPTDSSQLVNVRMPKSFTLDLFTCVIYILQDDIILPVSIKVANENMQDRRRLLQEAAILGQLSHRNIVRLCGVVSESAPVSLFFIFLFFYLL